MDKQLLFVYNAQSSVMAQLTDYIHKTVSPKTYGCNLCGLTYGAAGMKNEWKQFLDSLPLKAQFLHKDEFLKEYPGKENITFPVAFIKENDTLVNLITTEEINQQQSLDDLKALVKVKTAKLAK